MTPQQIYPLELGSVDNLSEVPRKTKATPKSGFTDADVSDFEASHETKVTPKLESSNVDVPEEVKVTSSSLSETDEFLNC